MSDGDRNPADVGRVAFMVCFILTNWHDIEHFMPCMACMSLMPRATSDSLGGSAELGRAIFTLPPTW